MMMMALTTCISLSISFHRRAILQNEDLHQDTPLYNVFVNDFWGTPLRHSGSHKSYRPLCTLTFRINHYLSGLNPLGYHLTNVLLHALATYLLVVYARRLFRSGDQFGPLCTGLTFAVHPVHTEAVAGIVGRADVLAGIFFISSLLCFDKFLRRQQKEDGYDNNNYLPLSKATTTTLSSRAIKWLALTIGFTTCAMFSKEQGITALSICALQQILRRPRKHSLSLLATSTLALFALRIFLIGFKPPSFAKADNPAASSDSLLTRSLTFLYLPAFNVGLLLAPHRLSFDWSMDAIPLVTRLSDGRNLSAVALYFTLALAAFKVLKKLATSNGCQRGDGVLVLATSIAMMVIPFLPATNVLFYVGFVVAERILYIPSMGYCLLLAFALSKLKQRRSLLVFVIVFSAVKTVTRNDDWKSEESLYRSGLSVNPAKGKTRDLFLSFCQF